MKYLWQSLLTILGLALFTACSVKYQFTGTSINYDLIKTIQIDKVANRAPYGWAPMEAMLASGSICQSDTTEVGKARRRLASVRRNHRLRPIQQSHLGRRLLLASAAEDDGKHPIYQQQNQ